MRAALRGVFPFKQNRSVGGDLEDLFGRRANDTFLVKMSYWFAW